MPDGTQGEDRIEAAVRAVLSTMGGDLTARALGQHAKQDRERRRDGGVGQLARQRGFARG